MEEKTYLGMAHGSFRGDDNAEHSYCNVYFAEAFEGGETETRHIIGRSAGKYRCTDPAIMSGIAPGTTVKCFFDSKGRLAYAQAVQAGAKAKD